MNPRAGARLGPALRRAVCAVCAVGLMVPTFVSPALAAAAAAAGTPTITTVAGGPGEGPARELGHVPQAVSVRGPLVYVADSLHRVVRVLDTRTGLTRAVAGTGARAQYPPASFLGDGGPATAADIGPGGLAVDPAGNLYIAEPAEARVRKVDAAGVITTYAGTGSAGYGGDGGPATAALLRDPWGLTLDRDGNLYIAEAGNHVVRRVSPSGVISTFAGTGSAGFSGDGGPAAGAQLDTPVAVDVDGGGRLFVADRGSHRVRRVDETGTITTVAGTDAAGAEVDIAPAPATSTPLWGPTDVSVDGSGNFFVTDRLRVHRVDSAGTIETVYGTDQRFCPQFCSKEGQAARGFLFDEIRDTAVGPGGEFYVADRTKVYRINAAGTITRVAGSGEEISSADGYAATGAEFGKPWALARDLSGNVYVADPEEHRARRISTDGSIATVAGSQGYDLPKEDGVPAVGVWLDPYGIAVGGDGLLYVADVGTSRVRRVDAQGLITTVAGSLQERPYVEGGPAAETPLSGVRSVAFDSAGNLYVAGDYTIWRVTPDGRVFRFAGSPHPTAADGGPASEAALGYPRVFVAPDDTVYLTDGGAVRMIDHAGIISTVYTGDRPSSVAVDGAGNLFIADNRKVVRRAPSGELTTVAGGGDRLGDGGLPTSARLDPLDLLLMPDGSIVLSDIVNHRVRRISGVGAVPVPVPPPRTPQAQYTVWAQPTSAPLDGVGTWIAVAEDPVARGTQLPPSYGYALGFSFTASTASGIVGLVTTAAGKYAVFSVAGPDGRARDAVVPFAWVSGRLYFPLVYQLGPGSWGAWIYDHAESAWVPIGVLSVPAPWGKLNPGAATAAGWAGRSSPSCGAYPRSDAFMYSPVGYAGSVATVARWRTNGTGDGDCPGQTSVDANGWAGYVLGAA